MALNPYRPERVGNLRERITWSEQVSLGSWVDRETVAARVQPVKGQEQFDGLGVFQQTTYRVFTRWFPRFDSGKWRLIWETGTQEGGRLVLDIKSIANQDERRRFIEVLATNTAAATEPDPPGEGEDGALINPGYPFASTTGWTARGDGASVIASNDLLEIFADFGDDAAAVAAMPTMSGERYFVQVETGAGVGVVLSASNNEDGTEPIAQSDTIAAESFGFIEFEATATTTYIVITSTDPSFGNIARIAGLYTGRLGEELISNPGPGFEDTSGWTAEAGSIDVNPTFGILWVDNGGGNAGRAVTAITTEIGATYRAWMQTDDDDTFAEDGFIRVSDNADGTSPHAEAEVEVNGGIGAVAFVATAETTYVVCENSTVTAFDYLAVMAVSARALLRGEPE